MCHVSFAFSMATYANETFGIIAVIVLLTSLANLQFWTSLVLDIAGFAGNP